MPDTALRVTEAARRLGIPTKALLQLIQSKQIRYVMVDGIAHIPEATVEEFRLRTES
jgi:excisionase family DNA binding protein